MNTATRDELMAAGFDRQNAAKIRRWVREYGPFRDLDELTKIDTIRGKALRKIRENLEV